MKRGSSLLNLLILASIGIIFITSINCVSAYNGLGFGSYGKISFSEIAESEWVNVALIFLLVFSVALFVIKDVFKKSYGAAVVISMVVAAMGSFGLIAYYGPVISKIGPWVLVLFAAVIALSLYRLFKKVVGIIWILLVLALMWLFWLRRELCTIGAFLPREVCVILDYLAIAIVIIAVFMLLWKLLNWLKEHAGTGTGGGGGRGNGGDREEHILTIGINGNGSTSPSPGNYRYKKNARKRVRARGNNFDHWELDGTSIGNSLTAVVLMNTDHTLIAVFGGGPPPGDVTLNMSIQGRGRTVPRAPGNYKYKRGARIRIRAVGNNFKHWSIDNRAVRGVQQWIEMKDNHNAVAVFGGGPSPEVTLNMATIGQGRTVPKAPGTYKYKKGTRIRIRAVGSNFKHWLIDNRTVRGAQQVIKMDDSHNVVAVFGKTSQPPGKPGKAARFEVIVGGKSLSAGTVITTDLMRNNRSYFTIKNSGTGGTIRWYAACTKGLRLSRKKGVLGKGRENQVILTVTDRNFLEKIGGTPHVTIIADVGGEKFGRNIIRLSRGKVRINYRIK